MNAAAIYVFTFIGAVGALDVLYFHIYRQRLYRHRAALQENMTHALRAFLYGAWAFLLSQTLLTGRYAWTYVVLAILEILNNTVDTVLEATSRRTLGGVPAGEYVLHVVLATGTGVALCFVLLMASTALQEPTAFAWHDADVPASVLFGTKVSVGVSVGFGIFELINIGRLFGRSALAGSVGSVGEVRAR